jgi:hypothetical protein
LPNSSVTEQSASASFARSGFVLYLSVMPNGPAGNVAVMLQNQGNVKFGQLPVPPGAKPVYVGDSTAMYATETAAPATADAVRKLFLAQGWVPYGSAGDSADYKQNAILVTATVSVAPAQGCKTAIQYSGQLISAGHSRAAGCGRFALRRSAARTHLRNRGQPGCRRGFLPENLAMAGWQSTRSHR